ncbi:MAG: hypothetical protein M1840_007644 [Geoglossum simile]|nr:MAG: hypothetical protein M1840_007644 [Geoglossum simile]
MDASHHRKIELQSPEDLRYLIDNVSRRAREKIDLNLPPSAAPEGEDALRRRVEELVHELVDQKLIGDDAYTQYVQQTFEYARHSISINGMDANAVSEIFSQEIEEYEPYDRRLHTRLQAVQSTLEASTLTLSQFRRTAPGAAANAYTQHSTEQAATITAAIASLNAAAVEGEGQMLDIKSLERQGEVERTYGRAVGELGDLKSGLPATVARLERARKAAEHVEGTR